MLMRGRGLARGPVSRLLNKLLMDEVTCMLLLPRELPAGGAPQVDLMDGGTTEEGRKFPADGEN